MDNLPPELQNKLLQLEFAIKRKHYLASLSALEELKEYLSSDYKQINQTHQRLKKLESFINKL